MSTRCPQQNRALGLPARSLILSALLVLNGCLFKEPFTAPEIVAGSETTVTLRSGHLRSADVFAQRHCGKYWRRAVLMSRSELSNRAIAYHVYNCVEINDR